MSEKGYELIDINRVTRCFIFQQGEPRTRTYHISLIKSRLNHYPEVY
ncbi:DUF2812 domain-containing protein [Paenibacillus pini]|nr:DUF2812 domain-containing protein [Paenibacillus pini]